MARGSSAKPRKQSSDPSSRIQQLVTDAITEKLEEKAARYERSGSANAALKAGIVREIQSQVSGLDVWTRPAPTARKARFSRDDITAAAIRIADAEGLEALSMRRIAQELGAGTMTIYHYVETKDELLTLVNDAVIGEVLIGDDEPELATWRDGDDERIVRFVRVVGTRGVPYHFGADANHSAEIEVPDFFIATTPVTQSFWEHVMGEPPACTERIAPTMSSALAVFRM